MYVNKRVPPEALCNLINLVGKATGGVGTAAVWQQWHQYKDYAPAYKLLKKTTGAIFMPTTMILQRRDPQVF